MTRRIFPRIEALPASCMAAGRSCASSKNCCSGSADGGCLRALGIQPEVCHLNEGHAAFAVLERARSFMQETAQPFDVALAVTRAGNLFTTHTAVAAGFDRFAPALIEQYLGGYAEQTARHPTPRFAGPGPPESERLVGTVQHGLSGDPRERGGQWREPFAWPGEPTPFSSRSFPAGRRAKCRSDM